MLGFWAEHGIGVRIALIRANEIDEVYEGWVSQASSVTCS
jgi:hypothetical protein